MRLAIGVYEEGGCAALRPTPRGRASGEGRTRTAEQDQAIRRTIRGKRPEQRKTGFAPWNRAAVVQLIEREFGVKRAVRTVGDYLKRRGLMPQKPIKPAYEQRPEAVKAWIEQDYPAIAGRAKAEGGEIHWGDETALANTDVRGRRYAPRGKTPATMAAGHGRSRRWPRRRPTRARPAG